jgi:hypothetical protein
MMRARGTFSVGGLHYATRSRVRAYEECPESGSVEMFARMAKSAPAKKHLMMQIGQIKEALKAVEQAGPPWLE